MIETRTLVRHRILASLCAAAVSLLASNVLAQARVNAGDRTRMDEARRHMEQGQTFYLQGRFAEAAEEFEAAHESQPFAAFLFNAGAARENAGDLQGAISLFDRYIAEERRVEDRRTVEHRRDALRTRLDAETAHAAAAAAGTGTPATAETTPVEAAAPPSAIPLDFKSIVNVRTTPDGATVTVRTPQGAVVSSGPSPFVDELSSGDYRLVIEHPDFNRSEETIHVDPGKVYVVVLNLSQGEFRGTLHVASSVPGARVFIDSYEEGARGTTPFEEDLRVGTHHIWIEKPGYQTIEQDVQIALGDTANVLPELQRVSFGRVRAVANVRDASVWIDNVRVGAIPWEGDVQPGSHHVRIEFSGMKTWEGEVVVSQGQVTPVRVRLRPAPSRSPAWVSGIVGMLSVGAGVGLALYANDLMNGITAARAAGNLNSRDGRIDQGFWMSVGADAAFGFAVLMGGVSLFYFLYDDLPPSEARVLDARDWASFSLRDLHLGPLFDVDRNVSGASVHMEF